MLVLSRRNGEEVMVPQYGIVFTILEIRGDRVRVGVSAPADVRLYRREIWERIERGEVGDEAVSSRSNSEKPRKKG